MSARRTEPVRTPSPYELLSLAEPSSVPAPLASALPSLTPYIRRA
ncbi:hypothetical protein [Streptomyces sp. NPDC058583]